jgi:hypothetical protein
VFSGCLVGLELARAAGDRAFGTLFRFDPNSGEVSVVCLGRSSRWGGIRVSLQG